MNICINSLDKAHFIIQSGSKAGELLSKFSRIVKFLKILPFVDLAIPCSSLRLTCAPPDAL